jgi:DNA-binding transcriptional LysR family regulator
LDTLSLGRAGIEVRHFRYFVALAEELHFGRAAARLNIVQPALTAQIKALERLLGVELLERSKRRVELTEAGREFQRESYAALAQIGAAVDTVTGFARGATGTLRLGFGANAAISGLLSNSVRLFKGEWPSVNVTLKEMASSRVSAALLRNEIDVGFAAATGSETAGIAFTTIGKWPWLLAVPDNHRLADAPAAAVSELSQENLAIYAEADGRSNIAGALFSVKGLSPQQVYKTSHITSLMAYVSSGLGVAFVPSPTRTLNFPGVVYVKVEDYMPDMEMRLLWRDSDGSTRLRNYLDAVQRSLPDRQVSGA